jgi:hypothetical protein
VSVGKETGNFCNNKIIVLIPLPGLTRLQQDMQYTQECDSNLEVFSIQNVFTLECLRTGC